MTTLILVPGLISDDLIWSSLAETLKDQMLIHHADLRAGVSITGMAETLLEAINGPLFVVGHSMGGRISLEMARIAPERIRGMVLANTGHGPKRDGEEIGRQKMIDLGHESMEMLADKWLPPMLDPARVGDKSLMDDLTKMVLRADAAQHERQIRALMGRPNASAYLSQITCPLLLLTGRQDNWSPVKQHREIADKTPNSTLVVIENAGHFAPIEQPKDVNATISTWLNSQGALNA